MARVFATGTERTGAFLQWPGGDGDRVLHTVLYLYSFALIVIGFILTAISATAGYVCFAAVGCLVIYAFARIPSQSRAAKPY